MTPINKWLLLVVAVSIISSVAWWAEIGIWASLSVYQFNVMLGQGQALSGVAVLLWEVEKRWYDDES